MTSEDFFDNLVRPETIPGTGIASDFAFKIVSDLVNLTADA